MSRPSLERTIKYIPVVPRAQGKLGREARRGSHDLRRLVGHANFLDTLMDQLDFGAVVEQEEETREEQPSSSKHISWSNVDFGNDEEWETENSSESSGYTTEEDDEDEAITPEADKEDLSLTRTISGHQRFPAERPIVTPAVEHPLAVTSERELDDEEVLQEMEDLDKGGYFNDQVIQAERAQLAESIAAIVDETVGVPAVQA